MKEVSEKQFEKEMQRGIYFGYCPGCKSQVRVTVDIPVYGIPTASVSCKSCNVSVVSRITSEAFTTKKKLGTPITGKTIGEAVKRVADAWNRMK